MSLIAKGKRTLESEPGYFIKAWELASVFQGGYWDYLIEHFDLVHTATTVACDSM